MECRRCRQPLERPGDYCLDCEHRNCDTVVVGLDRDEARVYFALDGELLGEAVHRTTPHGDDPEHTVELRNYVGRVADEVRRRRPERVVVRGQPDSTVLSALRRSLRYELERAGDVDLDEVLDEAGGLQEVDVPPEEKISGRHSTLIGGKDGHRALAVVAEHPNVKKIVPGPIDSTGRGRGFAAKITRASADGNLRLLVRDGSSVQQNRVVTTAGDADEGDAVREQLNGMLADDDLQ